MDRVAWQTTVHGVAKSQTRLSDCAHARVRAHTHTHTHTSQGGHEVTGDAEEEVKRLKGSRQ